jgi:UDP-N-acetyl-2-amino-2-deoxyglucuronate dehydrogenase
MDRRMIRAGVIGLGRIGHAFGVSADGDPLCHSEAYARLPEVRVAAGVDPDPERRAAFAARFPQAAVAATIEALPPGTWLDVVSVASPTPVHHASVSAALRLGARVMLVEKPLAPTAVEAEALGQTVSSAGCKLVVNYSRRFAPLLPALAAAVAPDGPLGGATGVCLRYSGGLVHNGTHWLDLLCALFGPPASAARSAPPAVAGADPPESVHVRWDNGLGAHLVPATGAGWSVGEAEIWGRGGIVRMTAGGRRLTLARTRPSPWAGFSELGPEASLCEDGLRGHVLEAVREVVRLATGGGVPACGAADGVLALRLAEQVREEVRQEVRQEIQEQIPHVRSRDANSGITP